MTLKYCNVADVPLALAVFLATDHYDTDDTEGTISATALLKPLRQIILPPRIPLGEGLVSLPDMMASRIGTAIHDGIERAWLGNLPDTLESIGMPKSVISKIAINPKKKDIGPDTIPIYLEQRLKRKIGKWTVTGKFDFVGDGMVQDFKSTSVWVYQTQSNVDKFSQQGSIYRWLGEDIITNDHMQVHYIFTDWKGGMQKSDPKYPAKRYLTQTIPLMTASDTNSFIANKLSQIEKYWAADEEMIPHCTDEELWRSAPVYKYYKNPLNTKRSTKNFDSMQDAYVRVAEDHNVGIVITSPGEVKACRYCPAFAVCSQKDDLIASGDLVMN